ncbi:MAG: hypothetical protein JSV25_15265 [Spirochaetota bacterium]|nr:MAG: hypothetical protein JSV25_15265 [Spirochaetota bacterium]
MAISYLDHITTTKKGRAPVLQHNPHRQSHGIEAYVHTTSDRYPPGLVPPVADDSSLDGDVAYESLKQAAQPYGIRVVPWILFLSQRVAENAPETQVVNAAGDFVKGWLCPSRPDTIQFVQGLVEDTIERHHPPVIFIDGVRFPEPVPHSLIDFCSCFCDACYEKAKARGIDLGIARSSLISYVEALKNNPGAFAEEAMVSLSSGFRMLRKMATQNAILEWLRFRHSIIERLIAAIKQTADGRTELWLDVWPPSYGWLLGQDLSLLAHHAQLARPFTYHRIGGGADIPGLIGSVSPDHDIQQALYRLYKSFFNFPGPSTFKEFLERGLDPEFITVESVLTKEMLAGHSKILAGLQIWQVGKDGVYSALEHAFMAEPHGVILHCFGWATSEEISAAGQWFKDRGIV